MLRPLYRAALWALVVALLVSPVASLARAATVASTTYVLTGYVDQPGAHSAPPVPAGVQVDLQSAATGSTYTAVTGSGGQFTFSSASGATTLAPGYWKVWVPVQANVSITGCGKCAVLPGHQNPLYAYYNSTQLTSQNYSATITDVSVLPYNATQNGTVHQGASVVQGAAVKLLDPQFNGLVLSNTTTNINGTYSLAVPFGTWVLQSSHLSGPDTFTNSTKVTIAARIPTLVNPVLSLYSISGWINSTVTGARVPTAGNATLYDAANGFIYSTATPVGGYYSLASYPGNFLSGNTQTFNVILSANGYSTTSYTQNVSASGAITKNVQVSPFVPANLGVYQTTLNLAGINVAGNGTGVLKVATNVTLGNDSVVPGLPNASVGQLWAQLGLDFDHSLTFSNATSGAAVQSYLASSGPFFPATQASAMINGTTFVAPTAAQTLTSFNLGCATTCGLTSTSALKFGWSSSYKLNGTLAVNVSTYTLGFSFLHPASSAMVYNYTVQLPHGYVLSAGTTAPSRTKLVAQGAGGTWNKFTLISQPYSVASASAKFTFVKVANLTPIVNVTGSSFAFSSKAVTNDTEGSYTVVLGVGESAIFSASNSVYPTGMNGTSFTWNFGDGTNVTTNNSTYNYTYTKANVTGHAYAGTLTVTDSGGSVNSTKFNVYVLASTNVPTATITTNATANDTKYTGSGKTGTMYLMVNSSTTLSFNATAANASVPAPNVLSIASYSLVAKNAKKTANYTTSSGGSATDNWSVEFSPGSTLGGVGNYLIQGNVSNTKVSFFGWEYNLTLTVWTVTGSKAATTLSILVVDKIKPTASFDIQNSAGKKVPSSGITEGQSQTATVRLVASNSTGPGNSSITKFSWNVSYNNTTIAGNPGVKTSASPPPTLTLAPEPKPYTVNLTVTDAAGNTANVTQTLTVAPNSTYRPVMTAANLTGPTSLTQGDSYTYWLNVSNTGGNKSSATSVTVTWYLLSPSGTGSKKYISATTTFYTLSKGAVNTSIPSVSGTYPALTPGKTLRAQISWSPSFSGNYIVYANVTATNEYTPDYHGGSNVASLTIAIKVNPTTQALEYGGIAAVVIVAIVGLIWWYRRPARGKGGSSKGTPASKSGLERGAKKADADDDDEP